MLTVALLLAAAIAAAVDWWAVGTGRRSAEQLAKPATILLPVAVAATWGDAAGAVRAGPVVGAVFGVIGDVALLGSGEEAFLAGLSSFAAGHLAYAAVVPYHVGQALLILGLASG